MHEIEKYSSIGIRPQFFGQPFEDDQLKGGPL